MRAAPPVLLCLQGERPALAAAESCPGANLMGDTYIIDGKLLMVLGGLLSLVVGVLGWLARAYLKRIESGLERVDKKIDEKVDAASARLEAKGDANFDKLDKKADANFDKLDKKADANHDKLDTKIDEKVDAASARLEAKGDANFDKLDKKADANFDKLDKKADANHDKLDTKIDEKVDAASARLEAKADANHDKLDKKGEERHREVQATLLDLTYKVGKLDGAGDVNDGSADQSRQSSLRPNNDPAPTPSGAPDPARIAERYDRSMVPLAGVRPEPVVPAGLVRQAAPGQKQTSQQDSETGPEPHAEDAPDATR